MNNGLQTGPSAPQSYRLIDFGGGRKLEQFAGYLIDRPSPAAQGVSRRSPQLWKDADASYDERGKSWLFRNPWPDSLSVDCGGFQMPIHPTPYGHVGLFPEQEGNWVWLRQMASDLCSNPDGPKPTRKLAEASFGGTPPSESREGDDSNRIGSWGLNLFGYTGASTMAMVSEGFSVAHVDAAKPNVQACRMAARFNGWCSATIRYLVDDALKFARREVRRNRRYQMIVLDPPAYGHAPSGKAWRLERDLWPLLDTCIDLLDESFALLITGHSPEVDAADVWEHLRASPRLSKRQILDSLRVQQGRSAIQSIDGRSLDSGFYVRTWASP